MDTKIAIKLFVNAVKFTPNGKAALLFLMKNNCCLIILEITLSEMDGAELIQTIRKRSVLPILVLSSDGLHTP